MCAVIDSKLQVLLVQDHSQFAIEIDYPVSLRVLQEACGELSAIVSPTRAGKLELRVSTETHTVAPDAKRVMDRLQSENVPARFVEP